MSGPSPASRSLPTAVPGAGGVVFSRDGRVLLLGHASGAWVFPKGHVEEGETSHAAALREVAEEAGVAATLLPHAPTWTTTYHNDRGVPRCITWYACTTDASQVAITEHVFTNGGFFAPEDALSRLTHQCDRELLGSVLASIETAGAASIEVAVEAASAASTAAGVSTANNTEAS